MYIDAVCYGLDDLPKVDPSVRNDLNKLFQESGIKVLQEELMNKDPEYYKIVDLNNPQRLIRALEVIRGSGKTFTSFRKKIKKKRPFKVIKVGLEMDRQLLYDRIDVRMDKMIEKGLFEEAESLFPLRHLNALQTVGYQEIFGHLKGEYDKQEAIRLLKRNSRRYAKRQMTWFKKDESTHWFHPSQSEEIKRLIENELERLEPKS